MWLRLWYVYKMSLALADIFEGKCIKVLPEHDYDPWQVVTNEQNHCARRCVKFDFNFTSDIKNKKGLACKIRLFPLDLLSYNSKCTLRWNHFMMSATVFFSFCFFPETQCSHATSHSVFWLNQIHVYPDTYILIHGNICKSETHVPPFWVVPGNCNTPS